MGGESAFMTRRNVIADVFTHRWPVDTGTHEVGHSLLSRVPEMVVKGMEIRVSEGFRDEEALDRFSRGRSPRRIGRWAYRVDTY